MEDKDKEVDEPQEEIIEEEVEDIEIDDTPTLEDFEKAQKAIKTLKAQKEHWKTKFDKVKQVIPVEKEKKPELKNNKNESLSTDDVISLATIVASGVHPDVLKEARELSSLKGISVSEALELPSIKAYSKELAEVAKKEKAQIGSSNGSSVYQDFKKKLTPEEHRKLWEKSQK